MLPSARSTRYAFCMTHGVGASIECDLSLVSLNSKIVDSVGA